MFCTNCGKRIIDTARFCNYCGAKIVEINENRNVVSDNITENPAPLSSENVINTENVENLGNLLNMTASIPSSIPQMNEPPKSGYSPDSMPISQNPTAEPYAAPAASVLSETGTSGSELSATPTTSSLSETGTAPAYPDPTAAAYGAPTASSLPETGTAPTYPDPAAAAYGAPTASSLPETGTAPTYPDPAAAAYGVPAASVFPEMGTPNSEPPAIPAVSSKEETPRKYTLGHLIMCLAASGVMAIAAGIFAGLYFSVV